MVELEIRTSQREQALDVTEQVREAIARSGVKEGICFLYSPHTTCAVTVNEAYDPAVKADFVRHLHELVPQERAFQHAEGNSDAHIKAMLVGPSVQVPVSQGSLRLGRWQGVFMCEFDGPRDRQLWIEVR
ncbi:MAG TPA: secondary thiamine-phosphate synthase enzyme YjbQ [Candidatus Dormibacteraeota bacterium]